MTDQRRPHGTSRPPPIVTVEEFIGALRTAQRRSGLSYREIAEKSGQLPARGGFVPLAHSTLGDLLSITRRRVPTNVQLRTLLAILKLPPSDAKWLLAAHASLLEQSSQSYSSITTDSTTPQVVGVLPERLFDFQIRPELDQLLGEVGHGRDATAHPHVVVVGLGGVGKTQLAAHTARHLVDARKISLLVWVGATTRAAILTGYADAAAALALPGTEANQEAHIERYARLFLASLETMQRPWIVILDGLEHPAAIRDLWPPKTPQGRAMITTRRQDATLIANRIRVSVDVFRTDDAIEFLAGRIPSHLVDSSTALSGVVADLGRLPLALSHAAAFMIEQGISCLQYRDRFADQRRQLAELFVDPETLFDGSIATVATTWAISIKAAEAIKPLGVARRLLELASMLDSAGIPDLALTCPAALNYLGAVDADTARAALANLHRFSLAASTANMMRVHSLVQRAVRDQLQAEGRADEAALSAAAALIDGWPDPETDPTIASQFRANTAALETVRGNVLWRSQDGGYRVLFRSVESLGDAGLLEAAVGSSERLRRDAERELGPDHPDTLVSRSYQGHWRGEAGNIAGAITILEELLIDRLRILGADHLSTLTTRSEIIGWRGKSGDAAGAVSALQELLADMVRVLGPSHPSVLGTRANLAGWRGATGDAVGAARDYEQLIPDMCEILGPDDLGTLTARNNLAVYRGEAGDAAGAAAAFEEILADRLRVVHPHHPSVLAARNNVAAWRGRAGDAAGAVAAFTELLADRLLVLGPHHPDTLISRANLADWRGKSGDSMGAAVAFEELLADRIRILGSDHPVIVTTRENLAYWRAKSEDVSGAVVALENLLADRIRLSGPDNHETVTIRANLAFWRGKLRNSADAPSPLEALPEMECR